VRNWIFGILIIISTIAFGQKTGCKNFKNGKFQIIDAETGNSIIERNGSKQIEYGKESKMKLELKVKWLNDCSYTLELNKVIENPNNIKLPEGLILTVVIIETKENSYIQKTSSNLHDKVLEAELFRIE